MNIFSKIIVTVALGIASLFGYHQQTPLIAGSFTPVGGNSYTLSGAGITSSATTIQLTSFTLPDPNKTPITMTMLGQVGYGVIEPQSSKIEDITFTGITQNANGTAILTGVSRGISFYTPYQASTTLALSHSGGSNFILSNTASFYGQQFLFANQTGTSTQQVTIASTSPWRYDNVGAQASGTYIATTSEFASIAFVIATGAGVNVTATEGVKGISQLATQLQMASSTFSAGTPTVLYTKYSTSTPFGAGLWIPVTQNNGKLNQSFLDLTQSYVWSGQATSTANATSTATFVANSFIATSSLSTPSITLNGFTSTSTIGAVFEDPGSYTTSQTSTTTLATAVIPANSISSNGSIKVEAFITGGTGGSNQKCIQLDFGTGTATTTIVGNCIQLQTGNGLEHVTGIIRNIASLSSQMLWGEVIGKNIDIAAPSTFSYSTTSASTRNTGTQTYISLSGFVISGADSVTIKGFTVTKLP